MLKAAKIYSLILIPPLAQYVVTLEEIDGSRLVPIWIGVNEGNSIAMVLQGEKFQRPLTHDLMINILKDVKAEIEKIIISDLRENAYYAIIALRQGDKTLNIDS
ncbi:MAG: bifunctional nuclease family protein, partial [Candidatus Omnitrophota bacterium]|nr:bifunctional nuclease family protein [Candidatus Omnitrophota bacterium]